MGSINLFKTGNPICTRQVTSLNQCPLHRKCQASSPDPCAFMSKSRWQIRQKKYLPEPHFAPDTKTSKAVSKDSISRRNKFRLLYSFTFFAALSRSSTITARFWKPTTPYVNLTSAKWLNDGKGPRGTGKAFNNDTKPQSTNKETHELYTYRFGWSARLGFPPPLWAPDPTMSHSEGWDTRLQTC